MPNLGVVVAVRGSVVDVRFDVLLPPIFSLLRTGANNEVLIEVLAQRDARHVRAIALTATQGLARGMSVEDTGGPLMAPVGKCLLSRMFDVFGKPIDRGPPLTDVTLRSVHRAPPALCIARPIRRSSKPASRPSTSWYLSSGAEKPAYLAARGLARPCCSRK